MQINILVTVDQNYILPLRIFLHALCMSDPDDRFTVYVAHSSLCEADFRLLRAGVDASRCTLEPVFVEPGLLEDAPVLRRLSKESYSRLIAPSYLPDSVDRILYLDPDITVLRSLSDFYAMDLQGNYIAAAGHFDGFVNWINQKRLRIRHNGTYINSGVLLMDVRKLRALDNNEQIFDYVRRYEKRLFMGDQDTVNAFYDGHILVVDPFRYNLDERVFRRLQKRGEADLDCVRNDTVILHYDGRHKPWHDGYDGVLGSFFFRVREDLETMIGERV